MKVYIVQTVLQHPEVGMFMPVFTDYHQAMELQGETGAEIAESNIEENFDEENT